MISLCKESTQLILAAQNLVNSESIIKELLDNSIDSGASKINIYSIEYSVEEICVMDNGRGINYETLKYVCIRGTSNQNIEDYNSIYNISTIGFRGQALNSLCNISNVIIISIEKENPFFINFFIYDFYGNIKKSFIIDLIDDKEIENTLDGIFNESFNCSIYNANSYPNKIKFDSYVKRFLEFLEIDKKLIKNSSVKTGTCIISMNIFNNKENIKISELEVRRKMQIKEKKKILQMVTKKIQVYSLINHNISFEFYNCNLLNNSNIGNKNYKDCNYSSLQLLVSSKINTKNCSYYDNLKYRVDNVFGIGTSNNTINVEFETNFFKFKALLSKTVSSGSVINIGNKKNNEKAITSNVCLYFVNNKHVSTIKSIDSIICNFYTKYNKNSIPFRIVILEVPKHSVDFNLDEMKMNIRLKNEKRIAFEIEKKINEILEDLILSNIDQDLKSTNPNLSKGEKTNYLKNDNIESIDYHNSKNKNEKNIFLEKIEQNDLLLNDKCNFDYNSVNNTNNCDKNDKIINLNDYIEKKSITNDLNLNNSSMNEISFSKISYNDLPNNDNNNFSQKIKIDKVDYQLSSKFEKICKQTEYNKYDEYDEYDENNRIIRKCKIDSDEINYYNKNLIETENKQNSYNHLIPNVFYKTNTFKEDKKLNNVKTNFYQEKDSESYKLNQIKKSKLLHNTLISNFKKKIENFKIKSYRDNSIDKDKSNHNSTLNLNINANLNHKFKKENFKDLEIIGQFNAGFIICRFKKELYIIDQHAADEKYNYEELILKSKITSQKLIFPMNLNFLSIIDKIYVFDRFEYFQERGFILKKNNQNYNVQESHEDNDKLLEKEYLSEFFITAFPMIYDYKYSKEDFLQLIDNSKSLYNNEIYLDNKKKENDNNFNFKNCRKSELENKLLLLSENCLKYIANKSCRSSIMIGDFLKLSDMKKILKNLSNLVSPWNCPHGRPTIRKINNIKQEI